MGNVENVQCNSLCQCTHACVLFFNQDVKIYNKLTVKYTVTLLCL